MKKTALLTAWIFIAATTFCQQTKTRDKVKFRSINQVGFITGSNGESGLLQTINGVAKNKWSAGIGTGIDFYAERGIPLFLDVRRDLLEKKNTPFLYADGGVNFPWLNFIQREQRNTFSTSAGLYYDLGAGWKLKTDDNHTILISAGYSFKQSKGKGPMYTYNPVTGTGHETTQYQDFRYRRLVIKFGMQF